MMKKTDEMDGFKAGLQTILKANPKVVQAAMDAEKREREEARKAKRVSSKDKEWRPWIG